MQTTHLLTTSRPVFAATTLEKLHVFSVYPLLFLFSAIVSLSVMRLLASADPIAFADAGTFVVGVLCQLFFCYTIFSFFIQDSLDFFVSRLTNTVFTFEEAIGCRQVTLQFVSQASSADRRTSGPAETATIVGQSIFRIDASPYSVICFSEDQSVSSSKLRAYENRVAACFTELPLIPTEAAAEAFAEYCFRQFEHAAESPAALTVYQGQTELTVLLRSKQTRLV